jgi:hypothetical protein
MTIFRIYIKRIPGLAICLLIVATSSNVLAQSQLDGEVPVEGLSDYIFSPYAITVLLVLALIGQIVYRQWSKSSRREEVVTNLDVPSMAVKKRYDRDEISKLLKASASSKKKGRTLEEAIKLSQLSQPNSAEILASHSEQRDLNETHGSGSNFQEHDATLTSNNSTSVSKAQSTEASADQSAAPTDK